MKWCALARIKVLGKPTYQSPFNPIDYGLFLPLVCNPTEYSLLHIPYSLGLYLIHRWINILPTEQVSFNESPTPYRT